MKKYVWLGAFYESNFVSASFNNLWTYVLIHKFLFFIFSEFAFSNATFWNCLPGVKWLRILFRLIWIMQFTFVAFDPHHQIIFWLIVVSEICKNTCSSCDGVFRFQMRKSSSCNQIIENSFQIDVDDEIHVCSFRSASSNNFLSYFCFWDLQNHLLLLWRSF